MNLLDVLEVLGLGVLVIVLCVAAIATFILAAVESAAWAWEKWLDLRDLWKAWRG